MDGMNENRMFKLRMGIAHGGKNEEKSNAQAHCYLM